MKKAILITIILGFGTLTFSQNLLKRSAKAPLDNFTLELAPQKNTSYVAPVLPEVKHGEIKGRSVSYIPIGQSGNAYGFYGNPRTYLWADPTINSVVFTHRMTGGVEYEGNGRVAYDISIDGGTTWETNTKVYIAPDAGPQWNSEGVARYPQGAILNPVGNTDPMNAFYTYFTPTLDNSNGIWGGSAYGSNPLTETDPPNPTQVNLTSGGDFWRYIPDAYTSTTIGKVFYVDGNYEGADQLYNGTLTIGKGEIINGGLVFEESLIDFMEAGDNINDHKIAFGHDGLTGYIMIMSDWESNPVPFTGYHPVLLKTTDGGLTWGEPIQVQLGGIEGIESIKYYWHDTIWGGGGGPLDPPHRDSIWYNMGFHTDIIVDEQGNPNITGIIAIGSDGGWYPNEGTMATWHLYSNDGGNSWDAYALYDNIFFDGRVDDLNMYNRPYAMSTYDGNWLFFSWLDTDLDGAEENTNPNIFVVGYNIEEEWYGEVENVTELGLYWYKGFYGSSSQYVLTAASDYSVAEIPFVFTEYTIPGDPTSEMNFYYIDGYIYDIIEDTEEYMDSDNFSVAQNYPNPAIDNSSVLVTTKTKGLINLRITNIIGQEVYNESVYNKALAHTFDFNVIDFKSGIYIYTIEIGNKSISMKMIVQ